MIIELKVPDIGQYSNVEIIEVPVKVGDSVQKEDPLVTLETEKASMDVPSEYAGVIKEMKVKMGDRVSKGDVIALIEVLNEGTNVGAGLRAGPSTDTAISNEGTNVGSDLVSDRGGVTGILNETSDDVTIILNNAANVGSDLVSDRGGATAISNEEEDTPFTSNGVHAGPATRQLARELGLDLVKISGTGRKGRIVTADVKLFAKNVIQQGGGGLGIEPAPEIDFSQFGEIEVTQLSRIKKWTAKNLHRNWVTIPHVTQFDEADITELEAFRQSSKDEATQKRIKLTPLPFIMKAVISALKAYPEFNASLAPNGSDLILKKYYHLGIAVDTPAGLMVPVIRNADTKGVFELAAELADLSAKAKEGKLKAEAMQGSCFSISSLGSVGGTAFTPIINAPDVAILGVSKAQIKPMYRENKLMPRLMLPLSLSYDHRVIDGVQGAKFIVYLAQQLQEIRKILL